MPQLGRSMAGAVGALVLILAQSASAVLPGDLDGDGDLDSADASVLAGFYGASSGDARWEPAADLDGSGRIDVLDLGRFGGSLGASGGDLDTSPPSLVVTMNDIPDDQYDRLVVPPDGFVYTLLLDSAGGSAIDTSSLSVKNDLAIGPYPAGSELASLFTVTPTRAAWQVPFGSELDRTSHYLDVSIRDLAGNEAIESYGYAVRDFPPSGQPLGNLQIVFLDFDQDRTLGTEVDFLEDLREFGLSSTTDPALEAQMRDRIVGEILDRTHAFYGRLPGGAPGPDAVNILFTSTDPQGANSRLCVGGESQLGVAYLGASTLDPSNEFKTSDQCVGPPAFGVFPQALDNLWGADPDFLAAFAPVDTELGGTAVGDDPLDATVLDASFDPATATAEQLMRWNVIQNAIAAFAEAIAAAVAHETGHLLGLTAHGAPPAGLLGGTTGANTDHNVTATGATPTENFLMNAGGTFTFAELTGRAGKALPRFRPLCWAYLRDRVVLNAKVTGLYPAPTISSVAPDPLTPTGTITVFGTNFLETPVLELLMEGDPTPNPVLSESFVNAGEVTGTVFDFLAPPGVYDVRLTNPDDQVVVLEGGLEIQP